MNALTFTLLTRPVHNVDMSPLIPDQLTGKAISKIKAMKLHCGNRSVAVDRLFKVSGIDRENICFLKSREQVNYIGRRMSRGNIKIKGTAGDFLGQKMTGGRIVVYGNAGNWTGSGMTGGEIEINGNSGNFLGAARPGDQYGMSNGTICIAGNAGDRVGDRMRRGIIVIRGDVGDYCGARLLAGTILVLGRVGQFTGYGMKRGTIVLAQRPKRLVATFTSCGQLKMEFLRLLFRQLARRGRQYKVFKEFGPEVHRFAGDLSWCGKGEILILE